VVLSDQDPIRPSQLWSDRTRSAVFRSDKASCGPIGPGQLWSDRNTSAVVRSDQVSCGPIGPGQLFSMPPSAPERTLQASGQGQAIARLQGRPTLLLRACTIYALCGDWREPAAEDKLCVPVPRQAHTRTRAYVCNLMRSPGGEILRKAGCRRERTIKRLQMEAIIIAHA